MQECSRELYEKALLVKYYRQILLTRTAGAWYVLPVTTGLVVQGLGYEHAPELGRAMASFFVAAGVVIAVVNWKAANTLAAEKEDLQRLLRLLREPGQA